MTRLAEDIAFLQRAADTAGLVIYPGGGNRTFPSAENVTTSVETLAVLLRQLEERRIAPVEYRLIDYPAVWLLQAAHQLKLHEADRDELQTQRFREAGQYFRAIVEADLVRARKSNGEVV